MKENKNLGYSVHCIPHCVARQAVIRFAEEMEKKLKEKDEERGEEGWLDDNIDISFLLSRLKEEVIEVEDAFSDCRPNKMAKECVDVANFAMMIWDRLRRYGK